MASRQQAAGQQSRREVAARLREERARRGRRTKMGVGVGVSVAVLAVAGGTTAAVLANRSSQVDLSAVKTYQFPSPKHVTGTVAYAQSPPAGGDHDPTWLNCGIYTAAVRNENAVHDLEHGAVWITYRPDLPAAQITALQTVARGQTYVTLSPYKELPGPVVVTAWGKQLILTGAADNRLPAFIAKYKQGPQTPEPGAPCTGGTGTPNG